MQANTKSIFVSCRNRVVYVLYISTSEWGAVHCICWWEHALLHFSTFSPHFDRKKGKIGKPMQKPCYSQMLVHNQHPVRIRKVLFSKVFVKNFLIFKIFIMLVMAPCDTTLCRRVCNFFVSIKSRQSYLPKFGVRLVPLCRNLSLEWG